MCEKTPLTKDLDRRYIPARSRIQVLTKKYLMPSLLLKHNLFDITI